MQRSAGIGDDMRFLGKPDRLGAGIGIVRIHIHACMRVRWARPERVLADLVVFLGIAARLCYSVPENCCVYDRWNGVFGLLST